MKPAGIFYLAALVALVFASCFANNDAAFAAFFTLHITMLVMTVIEMRRKSS